MKTKSLTLVYTITKDKIIPPPLKETERKDEWIKGLQRTIEADWKPLQVRVLYRLVNPEVENLRRFFHTCVKFFAIQDMDMIEGDPDSKTLEKYREEVLDELLGYDYQTVNKVLRRRTSTADYKDTQPWLTLLKNLEETLFDSHGYEFPESEAFWELVKRHGYDQAQEISIKALQNKMSKKI